MRLEERCHFFNEEALRHVEKAAAAQGQRRADGPLEPSHVTEKSRRRLYEQCRLSRLTAAAPPPVRGCAAREGNTRT